MLCLLFYKKGGGKMATVDSLEVKITSDAKSASDQLDKLYTKLNSLIKPLSSIMDSPAISGIGKQAKAISQSVGEIGKSVQTARKPIADMQTDLNRLVKELSRKSISLTPEINTKNIQGEIKKYENQLRNSQNALNRLMASTDAGKQTGKIETLTIKINEAENALYRIAEIQGKFQESLNGMNTGKLDEISQKASQMSEAFTKAASGDKFTYKAPSTAEIAKFVENYSAEAGKAAKISENLGEKLKNITVPEINIQSLKKLESELSGAEKHLEELRVKLANGITMGRITESVDDKTFVRLQEQIAYTEKYAEALKNKIAQVGAGEGKTGSETNKLASTFGKLASGAGGASGSLGGLGKSLNKTLSGMKSVTRSILSAAGIMGGLYGVFRGIAEAMDISSDLTEVQNVVVNTFGQYAYKLEELASKSIQSLGMSELSTKQVASKFQAMGTAMGFSAGKMSDMSIELTKLTADMASFYNVSQKDVAKSLESVFTGTTMPLRKYGLDLTQATLQEWALKQGLDADMRSMSQAEKTMLRYQYVMAQTSNVQGDFARTADTWANQLRILKEQFRQLAGIVGTAFINILKPVVSALNKVLSAVIEFTKKVVDALGFIFGWKLEIQGGTLSEAADAADGMAEGTGVAADNAKKMNKELKAGIRAFDELKVISIPDKSGAGGGGGTGGAGGGAGAGGEGNDLKASIKETEGLFKSNIKNLEQLGEYIGNALTKAMKSIKWEKVYDGARNFGSGLADFLNGLISPELFGAVGDTIAGSLNTALHFLNSFGTTFDWKDFGLSIATGINNFFSTFDFELLAETINAWIKGALKTAITLLKETDFEQIGEKIGIFLKNLDFLSIAADIAQTLWEALKASFDLLSGLIKEAPLETAIIAAIGIMKFTKLGSTLATKIGSSLAVAIPTAIAGYGIGNLIYEQISGEEIDMTFSEQMETIADSISDGSWKDALSLMGDDVWNFFVDLGDAIYDWSSGVNEKIAKFFAGIWKTITKPFIDAYNAIVEKWGDIIEWFKNLGKNIKLSFEDTKKGISDKFTTAKDAVMKSWEAVSGWFDKNIGIPVVKTFGTIKEKIKDAFSKARDGMQEKFSNVKGWFDTNVKDKISDVFSKKDGVTEIIKGAFSKARSGMQEKFSGVKEWFNTNVKDKIFDVFSRKDGVTEIIKGAFENAYNGIKNTFSGIGDFFKKIANKIIDPIGKAVNGVIKGMNWVLGKVGSKKKIGEWKVPKFASGTDGLPRNTLGMVNDQKGNNYKELILPPHGKPFIPEGRNVVLPMEKGTKIMPAKQTKEFMENIPHFAGGIGEFFSGAWEKLKDFTGNIMDYISDPKKIIQIAIDKFVDVSGTLEPVLSIVTGSVKTLADNAVDFVKGIFNKELTVQYDASKGVEQWRGLAEKALQITHQLTKSNVTYLLNQMFHESGGNPNAINLWDINAKKGTPSKGLMQLIDPTFKQYSLSPYNKNIYDPLSNMIASIRYTVSRYGSLYNGWAARGYKGYAMGGFPEPYSIFAAGERGRAEMLGTVGGKTAVAGGEEITGIRDAVNTASQQEVMLLREQNRLLQRILDKEFGITKEEIGRAARDYSEDYFNRTGNPAYTF